MSGSARKRLRREFLRAKGRVPFASEWREIKRKLREVKQRSRGAPDPFPAMAVRARKRLARKWKRLDRKERAQ